MKTTNNSDHVIFMTIIVIILIIGITISITIMIVMLVAVLVYRCEAQHDFGGFQVRVKGGRNQCLPMTMTMTMMITMTMMQTIA